VCKIWFYEGGNDD